MGLRSTTYFRSLRTAFHLSSQFDLQRHRQADDACGRRPAELPTLTCQRCLADKLFFFRQRRKSYTQDESRCGKVSYDCAAQQLGKTSSAMTDSTRYHTRTPVRNVADKTRHAARSDLCYTDEKHGLAPNHTAMKKHNKPYRSMAVTICANKGFQRPILTFTVAVMFPLMSKRSCASPVSAMLNPISTLNTSLQADRLYIHIILGKSGPSDSLPLFSTSKYIFSLQNY